MSLVIQTFKHKGLERFFRAGSKAGVQPAHAKRLREPLINSKNVGCALRTDQQNGAWDAPYIGLFRASLKLILLRLNHAREPRDMNLPGLKPHGLKDGLVGYYSVWISGSWRVVFQFEKAGM